MMTEKYNVVYRIRSHIFAVRCIGTLEVWHKIEDYLLDAWLESSPRTKLYPQKHKYLNGPSRSHNFSLLKYFSLSY